MWAVQKCFVPAPRLAAPAVERGAVGGCGGAVPAAPAALAQAEVCAHAAAGGGHLHRRAPARHAADGSHQRKSQDIPL